MGELDRVITGEEPWMSAAGWTGAALGTALAFGAPSQALARAAEANPVWRLREREGW